MRATKHLLATGARAAYALAKLNMSFLTLSLVGEFEPKSVAALGRKHPATTDPERTSTLRVDDRRAC